MKTGFLQLLGVNLLSVLRIARLDVAPPPTEIPTPLPVDVAPPTVPLLGLGLGVLVALCCLVVVVAVVAFLVIRAIKKSNAAKNIP